MSKKSLTGITWDHSRGYTPMIATSQRFSEINPEVTIRWEKRSLQEFADASIVTLAGKYDLLVLDHPWIGAAAEKRVILPLDQHLPPAYIKELASYSVGASYSSYTYRDHQWALPIDAATPVAAYRPDLLSRMSLQPPKTYSQLLEMASTGKVILPAIPIDTLMHFYMFCASLGEEPFNTADAVITDDTGTEALRLLKKLMEKVDPRCFDWNPVKVYEMMAETDAFIYCPFAYGYSNYSRKGYASHRLNFHDLVSLDNRQKLISTLGGTGIAVSSHTAHPDIAMQYIQYISSATCQQTLYFENGGQPAHYLAWTDYYANFQCAGFFKATLPALKRAYLRPRYNGYIDFQDHAGDIVTDYLIKGGAEKDTLHRLNHLYHQSVS